MILAKTVNCQVDSQAPRADCSVRKIFDHGTHRPFKYLGLGSKNFGFIGRCDQPSQVLPVGSASDTWLCTGVRAC